MFSIKIIVERPGYRTYNKEHIIEDTGQQWLQHRRIYKKTKCMPEELLCLKEVRNC